MSVLLKNYKNDHLLIFYCHYRNMLFNNYTKEFFLREIKLKLILKYRLLIIIKINNIFFYILNLIYWHLLFFLLLLLNGNFLMTIKSLKVISFVYFLSKVYQWAENQLIKSMLKLSNCIQETCAK